VAGLLALGTVELEVVGSSANSARDPLLPSLPPFPCHPLPSPYRDPRYVKTWPEWPKRDRRHTTSPDQRATHRKQPEEVKSSANRATEGLGKGQGSTRREAGRAYRYAHLFFSFFTTLLTLPKRTPSPSTKRPNGHVRHPPPSLWVTSRHDGGALDLPKPSLASKRETGGLAHPPPFFGSRFDATGVP